MTEETDAQQGGAEPEALAVETPSEATTEQATTPENVDEPDAGEVTEEPGKRVPWFQKRIDEVTADKHAERRRAEAAERRLEAYEQQQSKAPQPAEAKLPTLEECDWDEAKYQAALVKAITDQSNRTIDETLTKREREQSEAQKNQTAIDNLQKGGAKYPDFIAATGSIKPSEAIRDFLLEDTKAPDILYELGKDSAAAERFNNLSPVMQAIELGKRAATPKVTSRTIAPPPPQTVTGLGAGLGKPLSEMSMTEYAEARKAGKS